MDSDAIQQSLVGAAIIASSYAASTLFTKRTISVSGSLATLTGNESSYNQPRLSLLLGLIGASAILFQQKSSLFDTQITTLGWPGYLVSGFLIGLGSYLSVGCFETQAFHFIPNFSRPSIISVLITLVSAFLGLAVANSKPDWLNWFFQGDATLGISIDQNNGVVGIYIACALFFVIQCIYCYTQKGQSFSDIIQLAISFLSGGLYALGLIYSKLASVAQISSFLNVQSGWKMDAGVTLLAVILFNMVAFLFIKGKYSSESEPQTGGRLFSGAIIMGVGIGFSRMFIGTALVHVGLCQIQMFLWFVPGLLLGFNAERIVDNIRN